MSPRPPVYVFGWPSFIGGADTKLAHLLVLLHRDYRITLVPRDSFRLQEKHWTRFMNRLGIAYMRYRDLPKKLEGVALSMCNTPFVKNGWAGRVKARGLKVIWSGEMSWHHPGEVEAVRAGWIDKVLYVSETQRQCLCEKHGNLPWVMTGNYIDPSYFPFKERANPTFTIGRLSRPDRDKYPEDFPVFYEALGLPEARFRVMAWDRALARKYRWHNFDRRWDLLAPMAESQLRFLHSLDLFVYPLGHRCLEAWGRSTVEAMLTGSIPLVPSGHHFENLMVHGESGFICEDFRDYQETAHKLYWDHRWRSKLAVQCRAHAENELCNPEMHRRLWREALQ